MLFVEDLKPMKIYTKPMYLPTVEGNKKKGSAVFLLTPNYESSKALLNSNLFINNMRFSSYYIEKDLTYFISSKAMDKVDDVTETYIHGYSQLDMYHSLCEMTAAERNKLPDSAFGLPKKRKYPLTDKAHVKSAIKFFNYVDESDEAELARNINKAIKKFFSPDEYPRVSENNRFYKYYKLNPAKKKVAKESVISESYSFINHKSDKALYDWMMKNVDYKSNGIYDVNKIETEHSGDCHDQAGYLYYNLKKLGYKTGRIFMVEYSKWNSPGGRTHTACWYMKNNKYYWIEIAWGGMEGIHECGTTVTSVKQLIEKNWKFSGDNNKLFIGTCSGVKDGMTLNEYVNHCTSEKESVSEGYIISTPDIYYNKDKFDRGDINICFITGFSGSGKSTMSRDMTNCRHIELDWVHVGSRKFTKEALKKQDDMIYSFYTGIGKQFWDTDRELTWQDFEFAPALINSFIDYAIDYAKLHKNQKFVIEGVQLFAYVEPEKVKDYAVCIKGTASIKSLYRGAKRDTLKKKDKENVAYGTARRMVQRAKYVPDNTKMLNKWIEYYKPLSVVSESVDLTSFRWYHAEPVRSGFNPQHTEIFDDSQYENSIDDMIDKNEWIRKSIDRHNGKDSVHVYTMSDNHDPVYLGKITVLRTTDDTINWEWEETSGITDKMLSYYKDEQPRVAQETTSNNYKAYHLSSEYKETMILKASVPDNYMTKNGYEESDIPRVCFSNSIDGCLRGLSQNLTGKDFYVYTPVDNTKLYKPSIKEVPDSKITGEMWSKSDIQVKCIGKIHVDSDNGKDGIKYTYGKNTAELYDWNWSWVERYDTLSESTEMQYSVSALIWDDGKILLENHVKCGGYTLPGGKINPGEDKEQTLIRELGEELGITPVEYELYHEITFDCEYPVGSDNYTTFTDYCYNIKSYRGDIINKEPDKHTNINFFQLDDLFFNKELSMSTLLQATLDHIKDTDFVDTVEPGEISPDKITVSGYLEDIQILKNIATPEVYAKLLDVLELHFDEVPQLNFIGADKEDIDVHDNVVDVYMCSQSIDQLSTEQYIHTALDLAMIGLIIYKYPGLQYTHIPAIIVDWINGSDTEEAQFIDHIVDDYGMSGLYYNLSKENREGSLKQYAKKYNFSHYNDYFTEAKKSEKITAASLTSSLKYRGSTKTKIAVGKLRNTVKHLSDDTQASIKKKTKAKVPDAPTVNTKPTAKKESSILESVSEEAYIMSGDYVTFFEDTRYDPVLRRMLYKERLVKRKDVLVLLDRVKSDVSYIKFAYPELEKYQNRNVFVDLYYYNQSFFKNLDFTLVRAYNLYLDFLDRLINDKRIKSAGYKRRTVFIPVNDWNINNVTRMWMFKESINPISVIYNLMMTNGAGLKKLFDGVDVIFFDKNRYFKVNFDQDPKSLKKLANKFRLFIIKINKNESFESDDLDSEEETPTKKAVKTSIADKIEKSKGVDITKALADVEAEKSKTTSKLSDVGQKMLQKNASYAVSGAVPKTVPAEVDDSEKYKANPKKKDDKPKEPPKGVSKSFVNKPIKMTADMTDEEIAKAIAQSLSNVVDDKPDEEDAMDALDNDEFKELLVGLDSMKDDTVNINKARADRMSKLDRELLDKELKGKSVREILGDDDPEKEVEKVELPKTELPVASPNEEWKELQYINFDSSYDLDKDLVNIFKYWSGVSRPLSIRNIKVEDNSTSEDRLDLYTVDYEDYRGKRYTIKLDIPKMKNNRFLLRGNSKMIQTQFFNMPIIKTDYDTCQIVSNYKKIIIFRYNTAVGRSMPNIARFMKALEKYQGTNIKFTTGDNSKSSNKYVLPIDYIDVGSKYNTIETSKYKFYFDQDMIHKEYEINDGLGVPYGYDKAKKEILYYKNDDTTPLMEYVIAKIAYEEPKADKQFAELYESAKAPNRCTFVMAKIMGSYIPLVVVCAYSEGLTKVLKKANINYILTDKLSKEMRSDPTRDWIKFNDGYLVYTTDYSSSLLMNGLKDCDTESHSITQLDDRNMYLDFLDSYGGRIKADGLDNFYDCEIDPITNEVLRYYHLPTDYVSVLLYANYLLCDNKFIKHTDTSSRRARRLELVAAYTYQVLSEVYGSYSTSIKHNHGAAAFTCKQSAVIDKIMQDPTASDYSTINVINDVESTNAVATKGLSGMNNDRSYSLDKRTYDDSMVNVLGMSTGFSGNVGITRQATLNMNIEGSRGYVKDNKGKTDNMNAANTLTATESVVPLSTTHDDPARVAMTFVQSAKHALRTKNSDPLLVTSGSDEAMMYLCSDQFAYKAKQDGSVQSIDENGMIIAYKDGSKEYINLKETIEKNSDGGFYVPLKLDVADKIKEGSKFKQGQILAYDKSSASNSVGETDNIALNMGKLAKVAILNTDDGHEDAGIITSKMAEELGSRIVMKMDCILNKSTNIYNVAEVGTHVEQGDTLIAWQTPYEDADVNNLLKALSDKDEVDELGKHVLRAETTGTLLDMKIYRTVEKDELSDSLRKLVNKYEKPISDIKKQLKENDIEYTDLPANYALKPTGKLKKAGDGVLIEFYVEYFDIVGVGDKITYNAANKAVIKNVIPEGKEPYTDFRPEEEISAFVSEISITKRLVTSTYTYGALQKLMVELDRSCKDLAGIPWDHTKV